MNKKTTEEFIEEAIKINGDKYDYSKAEYKTNRIKLIVICRKHGEWYISPSNHLKGRGCPKCGYINMSSKRLSNRLNKKYEGLIQPDEYKLIPLSQGEHAMVDNEDFDRFKGFSWSLAKSHYAVNHKLGYLHRNILNTKDGELVDHVISENTLDNRKSNLRIASNAENSYNKKGNGKTSKFKGVCWDSNRGNWLAQIGWKGVNYNLGRFKTEEEAGLTYNKKALELFGEFAKLNKI